MSKKYLVTLRPLENYFFGGEITFGQDKGTQNYFVKSNLYPQQTTLLGTICFQLLKNNGLLPLNDNKKLTTKNLIGLHSFDIDKDFSFGAILNLSPLFMINGDDRYCFAPKYKNISFVESDGKMFTNKQRAFVPIIKGYDAKEHYHPDLLQKESDNNCTVPFDNVFKIAEQIGISKNNKGETDENAFFRQEYYRLAENWKFAFVVELSGKFDDDNKDVKFENDIVTMGGENSKFEMKIKPINENFEQLFHIKTSKNNAVILMSDAIVENSVYDHCKFAITETADLRYIKTETNSKRSYSDEPSKSKKINLLKRGSILFPDDFDKFSEMLSIKKYQKAGFNIFKTVSTL